MTKTCETCKWFDKTRIETDNGLGQCHLNPEYVYEKPEDWCSRWESKAQTDKLCPGVCKNCKSWLSLPQICSNTSQRLTYTSPEFWCEHWCEKPQRAPYSTKRGSCSILEGFTLQLPEIDDKYKDEINNMHYRFYVSQFKQIGQEFM